MKVTTAVFSTLALVGAAAAQDLNSLPQCGKDCINGLLAKADSFNCTVGSSNEANCLCSDPNFSYGVRDCSNEHCLNSDGSTDAAAASSVIAYGIAYCSSAGVAIPTTVQTVSSGTASSTVTGGAGAGASGSAIGTTTVLSTLTTDGSTITTSVPSTIFSSVSSSLASEASSISASASSALSSLSSAASGAASSATGNGGTSSSSAFAPQMTAAPVGFLAAAGLAAMLL